MLGRRTGELHIALASPTNDPAFSPEPLTAADLQELVADLRQQASATFDLLKDNMPQFPDDIVEVAGLLLSRRRSILDRLRSFGGDDPRLERTRIHGDYHLGQVLRVRTDYVIIDFEGEPARPLSQRRSKQPPLKDVAGMIRSFSYAAYSTLMSFATSRRPDRSRLRLEPWAQSLGERIQRGRIPARLSGDHAKTSDSCLADKTVFLKIATDIYLLDKALYWNCATS